MGYKTFGYVEKDYEVGHSLFLLSPFTYLLLLVVQAEKGMSLFFNLSFYPNNLSLLHTDCKMIIIKNNVVSLLTKVYLE